MNELPNTALVFSPPDLELSENAEVNEENENNSRNSNNLRSQNGNNNANMAIAMSNSNLLQQPPVSNAVLIAASKNPSVPTVVAIRPTYSSLRTNIIRITPESMKCKLYCKGTTCKYCSPIYWDAVDQAVLGVYSSWIDEHILAMARPTENTFIEYNLVKQFKRKRIKALFNLQCVNEHEYCGPSLLPTTGFSYDPELLMKHKIYYYNFAIPDFGITTVSTMLDIVKVMWFALKEGKIAIHCHAGLGRTGTLIACFFVWSQNVPAADAIEKIRVARPNSIQSVKQICAVEELAYRVEKYGTALPNVPFWSITGGAGISFTELMKVQRVFLPNDQAIRYAHIPKLLYLVCDRLLRLVFEEDGVFYTMDNTPKRVHNVRNCTFGSLSVNWKNAFLQNGREQVRQVVNLLARLSAFPYEKNTALIEQYQRASIVSFESSIEDLDIPQLVCLMSAQMEIIRRPYCGRKSLIEALDAFSPENPLLDHASAESRPIKYVLGHSIEATPENASVLADLNLINQHPPPKELVRRSSHSNMNQQEEQKGREKGAARKLSLEIDLTMNDDPLKKATKFTKDSVENSKVINPPSELSDANTSSNQENTNETSEANTSSNQENTMPIKSVIEDLHSNKTSQINADWHCVLFYICNVLSYLTGENYDVVVELIAYWFSGDTSGDVKSAVYGHMRDLFARNMRQQDEQAEEFHRRQPKTRTRVYLALNCETGCIETITHKY